MTLLRRDKVGFIFQAYNLVPTLDAEENITLPLDIAGRKPDGAWIDRIVSTIGLSDRLSHRPAELSGGQQQRVGVARALAADPPVLLMDEPFGAVDPIVRTRLQDELLGLQSRLHKTIVFVTHDVDEAIKLGDRVVVMNVGGIVEQAAPPAELLARPANAFVTQFVGSQRGLRRLGLIKIRNVDLDHGDAADGAVVVGPDDTLLDALDAMLREHTNSADVRDDGGRHIGTLTIARIATEVR
jgi:osmoprotectant transport system ATP-binding protein